MFICACAQNMDALSSQANLGGYKAVILGASQLGKIFPLLMTSAGTITPSRVLIYGAGVAGLQAIATAKRLGAVVECTDVRPETKEQIESLGGKFIEVKDAEAAKVEGGWKANFKTIKARGGKGTVVDDKSDKYEFNIISCI
jgi:NAD(P) transhydrogenase subunit alpha